MKLFNRFLLVLLVLALSLSALTACQLASGDETTADAETIKTPETTVGETDAESETEAETLGDETTAAPEYKTITIAEALELCGESGNITEERYYIRATVVAVTNATYGAMTIKDDTGTISVYGTYSADGELTYAELTEKAYKGDEVLLHCILQNYKGTKEVMNARLIEVKKADVTANEKDYTEMSIAQARDTEIGTKVKVDGVVARITYANGMIPIGVYLVDETQSIYVYDGDLAQRVAVGNKVTILASKTYWILDTEKNNADKFGYKGCCQLEDVTLMSNDGKTDNVFDKSWIEESTVKDILDTPVTKNITSTIFKVTALVKKVPGNRFVNYYFYDLDGTTGAYTYTQCNGNDFSWLDRFDGKLCTVYLSALNAKSTSSSCYFRFIPVDVIDEGFVFDTANTAQHVVKYYGVGQFEPAYTVNPKMELITTVSSELLGFTNATLTYTSANNAVVYFTEEGGKLYFNCGENGQTTVTVTGKYGDKEFSATLTITVLSNQTYETISIADAQKKAVGEIVTLRGIVGPSLVNKSGFYLFDGTGMIAVTVDASMFDSIAIGHEVVLSGKRDCYKNEGATHAGQICVTNAVLLANYYGENEYPTTGFITDKTLADIYALNVNEDHSTEVYVVKATVNFVETTFYSTISLTSGSDTKLSLYCSNAGQYSFLKQFAGQEVTLEIAPCNWNNKSFYVGCVLAVYTDNGKVLNELNFRH